MKTFEDVVDFHGHSCPGLAIGYRVSIYALKKMGIRSSDEELVAIVENNSCAIDAIQMITGCTFGKGNLIFKDYGKQVYTFFKRPSDKGLRISVDWNPPEENPRERKMWDRYIKGDRSQKVIETIHKRKADKIRIILSAKDEEIFKVAESKIKLPDEAKIYPSLRCELCNEKMMESRARIKHGKIVCIPCFEEES